MLINNFKVDPWNGGSMEWWIQKCAEEGGQMVISTQQIEPGSSVGTKPKENLRLDHG